MYEGMINGLFQALDGWNLLLIIFGTFMGIIFGSMPGLTATMGLALLVPFTFGMEPAAGLIMLAGIYVGAMYADAIPAILINTPGTPAAIATTFDGFPLAQKGKAQQALVTAAVASFFGSVVANLVLAAFAEPLAEISLKFGPPEYFWLGIFGLTIISVLSSGSLLKGYLAGFIGLILSAVGWRHCLAMSDYFWLSRIAKWDFFSWCIDWVFCLPNFVHYYRKRERNLFRRKD